MDNAVTGKFGVNWTASATQYLYAFAAKGYKSGGINGPSSPNFGPETVYDYEVGLKSNWLGGSLRTQINGFYMDYRNLQLSSYIPPASGLAGGNGVVNAGNSTVYGFEAQSQAKFGDLGLEANVAYVHSKLGATFYIDSTRLPGSGNVPLGPRCAAGSVSNPANCFNYAPFTQNLAGGPNPYSPELTVNVSAFYNVHIGGAVLTPRADFTHIGEQYQTILTTPANFIRAHNLLNLSLALKAGPWLAEAYGTNVTDTRYIVGYTYGPSYFLGRPSEYGFRVTRTF